MENNTDLEVKNKNKTNLNVEESGEENLNQNESPIYQSDFDNEEEQSQHSSFESDDQEENQNQNNDIKNQQEEKKQINFRDKQQKQQNWTKYLKEERTKERVEAEKKIKTLKDQIANLKNEKHNYTEQNFRKKMHQLKTQMQEANNQYNTNLLPNSIVPYSSRQALKKQQQQQRKEGLGRDIENEREESRKQAKLKKNNAAVPQLHKLKRIVFYRAQEHQDTSKLDQKQKEGKINVPLTLKITKGGGTMESTLQGTESTPFSYLKKESTLAPNRVMIFAGIKVRSQDQKLYKNKKAFILLSRNGEHFLCNIEGEVVENQIEEQDIKAKYIDIQSNYRLAQERRIQHDPQSLVMAMVLAASQQEIVNETSKTLQQQNTNKDPVKAQDIDTQSHERLESKLLKAIEIDCKDNQWLKNEIRDIQVEVFNEQLEEQGKSGDQKFNLRVTGPIKIQKISQKRFNKLQIDPNLLKRLKGVTVPKNRTTLNMQINTLKSRKPWEKKGKNFYDMVNFKKEVTGKSNQFIYGQKSEISANMQKWLKQQKWKDEFFVDFEKLQWKSHFLPPIQKNKIKQSTKQKQKQKTIFPDINQKIQVIQKKQRQVKFQESPPPSPLSLQKRPVTTDKRYQKNQIPSEQLWRSRIHKEMLWLEWFEKILLQYNTQELSDHIKRIGESQSTLNIDKLREYWKQLEQFKMDSNKLGLNNLLFKIKFFKLQYNNVLTKFQPFQENLKQISFKSELKKTQLIPNKVYQYYTYLEWKEIAQGLKKRKKMLKQIKSHQKSPNWQKIRTSIYHAKENFDPNNLNNQPPLYQKFMTRFPNSKSPHIILDKFNLYHENPSESENWSENYPDLTEIYNFLINHYFQRQRDKWKQKKKQMQDENQKSQQNLQIIIQQKDQENQDLTTKNGESNKLLEGVQKQLQTEKDKVVQKEGELTEVQNKLAEAERKNKQYQLEIQQLSQQVYLIYLSLLEDIKKLTMTDKQTQDIAKYKSNIKKLVTEDPIKQIKNIQNELHVINITLNFLKQNQKEQEQKPPEQNQQPNDQEKYDQLYQEHLHLRQQFQTLTIQSEKQNQEIEDLKKKNADLEAKIKESQQQYDKLEQQHNQCALQHNNNQQNEQENKNQIIKLQQIINQHITKLQDLTENYNTLQKEKNILEQQITKLMTDIQKKEDENKKLDDENKKKEDENQKLKDDNKNKDNENQKSKKDNTDKDKEIQTLNENLKQLNITLTLITNKYKTSKQKKIVHEGKIKELEAQILKLQGENATLKQENQKLQQQIKELIDKMKKDLKWQHLLQVDLVNTRDIIQKYSKSLGENVEYVDLVSTNDVPKESQNYYEQHKQEFNKKVYTNQKRSEKLLQEMKNQTTDDLINTKPIVFSQTKEQFSLYKLKKPQQQQKPPQGGKTEEVKIQEQPGAKPVVTDKQPVIKPVIKPVKKPVKKTAEVEEDKKKPPVVTPQVVTPPQTPPGKIKPKVVKTTDQKKKKQPTVQTQPVVTKSQGTESGTQSEQQTPPVKTPPGKTDQPVQIKSGTQSEQQTPPVKTPPVKTIQTTGIQQSPTKLQSPPSSPTKFQQSETSSPKKSNHNSSGEESSNEEEEEVSTLLIKTPIKTKEGTKKVTKKGTKEETKTQTQDGLPISTLEADEVEQIASNIQKAQQEQNALAEALSQNGLAWSYSQGYQNFHQLILWYGEFLDMIKANPQMLNQGHLYMQNNLNNDVYQIIMLLVFNAVMAIYCHGNMGQWIGEGLCYDVGCQRLKDSLLLDRRCYRAVRKQLEQLSANIPLNLKGEFIGFFTLENFNTFVNNDEFDNQLQMVQRAAIMETKQCSKEVLQYHQQCDQQAIKQQGFKNYPPLPTQGNVKPQSQQYSGYYSVQQAMNIQSQTKVPLNFQGIELTLNINQHSSETYNSQPIAIEWPEEGLENAGQCVHYILGQMINPEERQQENQNQYISHDFQEQQPQQSYNKGYQIPYFSQPYNNEQSEFQTQSYGQQQSWQVGEQQKFGKNNNEEGKFQKQQHYYNS